MGTDKEYLGAGERGQYRIYMQLVHGYYSILIEEYIHMYIITLLFDIGFVFCICNCNAHDHHNLLSDR